jgi:hypothetical protein
MEASMTAALARIRMVSVLAGGLGRRWLVTACTLMRAPELQPRIRTLYKEIAKPGGKPEVG